jgi:hypothetical protein
MTIDLFETDNRLTIPNSGTGRAAMERISTAPNSTK